MSPLATSNKISAASCGRYSATFKNDSSLAMRTSSSHSSGTPIDKSCSFLISNEGERISGQTIPVDGNATRLD